MHSSSQNSAIQVLIECLRTKVRANSVQISEFTDEQQFVRFATGRSPGKDLPIYALNEGICAHVYNMAHPLFVEDARSHPLIRAHPFVQNSIVGAYAGFPVYGPDQQVEAVFCAIFDRIHPFSANDRRELAAAVKEFSEMLSVPG